MNEVKSPKKPLIYYYIIAMLVVFLFNALLMPWIAKQQIVEVDYGTFISMIENRDISGVQVQDNQIIWKRDHRRNFTPDEHSAFLDFTDGHVLWHWTDSLQKNDG